MNSTEIRTLIRETFPFINQHSLIVAISENSSVIDIPNKTVILDVGDRIKGIPLVVEGTVKVISEGPDGGEVLLYYIKSGETCALTMIGAFKNTYSKVKAVAINDTRIIFVPINYVTKYYSEYPAFRDFFIDTFDIRFSEVLNVVDSISFKRLDQRLISYILEKSYLVKSDEISISHSGIAKDLNSSREVISRLLKKLEEAKLVETSRGIIKIINRRDLSHLL